MYRYRLGITIILTLVVLVSSGNAQPTTKLGFEGGMNIANGSLSFGSENAKISSMVGLVGGAVLDIGLSKLFSLQTELKFIRKGGEEIDNGNGYSIDDKFLLDYLDVPVLVKFNFPQERYSPHFFMGPDFAFNTGAEEDVLRNDTPIRRWSSIDINNEVETLNFSFDFGAGVDYSLTEQTTLILDGCYSLGVSNISSSDFAIASTRDFMIVTGMKFSL